MRDRRDHTNRVPKRDFFSSFASRFTRPGATMSREGADRAPPMRKRVRAARLTLAHASGLRYALGDRRGRPLSRFRSSASRQRHRAFNVPPDVEHARRLSAFSGRSRPRTPTDSRRSMARRDTANAPARREPKRALPPRPRARTERSIRNTTSSIHQKRLGKSARERLRESRVASTRRLTTTLSPFLTRVTDFSCA